MKDGIYAKTWKSWATEPGEQLRRADSAERRTAPGAQGAQGAQGEQGRKESTGRVWETEKML